jgi:hypothetical protein
MCLLPCQLGTGEIGSLLDCRHPALGEFHRLGRAVARTAQDECVGEPGDTEADAALGLRLLLLRRQRIVGDIDHVVEEAHSRGRQRLHADHVESGIRRERLVDQPCQIDRAQQTRPMRRQRLLSAVVCDQTIGIEGVQPGMLTS